MKKSNLEVLLPDKLKDCWDLAIKDLKACEKDYWNYTINMGVWYDDNEFKYHDRCAVCVAGAVMAQTLSAMTTDIRENSLGSVIEPDMFCEHNWDRLDAINRLRQGFVDSAASLVGISVSRPLVIPMRFYDKDDPEPFYKSAKEMSELLHKLDI